MAAPGSAPRATPELRVRVWGMGANQHVFFQNAVAENITAAGASLSGIENPLNVGDIIGVQYEGKKARCKVLWVMAAGGLKKNQVGVELIAEQECPWLAMLSPEPQVPAAAAVRSPENRRKFHRHKISYPIELKDERVNTPMRVNATDISGNGCYVESIMPLTIGTTLKVDLWIDQEHIATSATVRTRDPGVGMGIEFTGLTEESKRRFQSHLDQMDPGLPAPPKPSE
jgi:hypothetical protein